jgi:hypothetical protein
MGKRPRPYEELQASIERLGGTMMHARNGYEWGAWIVTLGGKTGTFLSNGRGYPDLDRLYRPNVTKPEHYLDYSRDLVPGAIEELVAMLNRQ